MDGLRGLAIVWVVAYHYFALPARAAGLHVPYLLVLADHGWIGVNLFFVLSGYLITQGLAAQPRSAPALAGFWIKRFMRIVPPYALLLLSLPLARSLWPADAPGAGRVFNAAIPLRSYVLFAQNFSMVPIGYLGCDWLRVLWSLAVEAQFYLFISVALFVIPRAGAIRWLAVLAGASVAFRFAIYFYGDHPDAALMVLLPSRLDGFLLGGILALAPRGQAGPLRSAAALAVAAASAAFMVLLYQGRFRALSVYAVPLYYTVISLGCTGLLELCARPPRPVELVMGWAPLVEAGRLSYFIYLFHMPVALSVFHFWLKTTPCLGGVLPAAAVAGSAACVWILAMLSFEHFEGPLIRLSHVLAARLLPPPEKAAARQGGSGA